MMPKDNPTPKLDNKTKTLSIADTLTINLGLAPTALSIANSWRCSSTAKLRGKMPKPLRQPHHLNQPHNMGFNFLAGFLEPLHSKRHIRHHRQRRNEVVGLKNKANVATAEV